MSISIEKIENIDLPDYQFITVGEEDKPYSAKVLDTYRVTLIINSNTFELLYEVRGDKERPFIGEYYEADRLIELLMDYPEKYRSEILNSVNTSITEIVFSMWSGSKVVLPKDIEICYY